MANMYQNEIEMHQTKRHPLQERQTVLKKLKIIAGTYIKQVY